jgi:hypothetical protein
MMQAFAYKHLVPARELTLLRTDQQRNRPGGGQAGLPRVPPVGQRAFQGSMSVLSDLPLRFPAGGKIEVRLRMPGLADQGEVQINLSDAPEGITIDKMSRIDRGMAIEIRSDAAKAKPGLRGNLIANVFQNRTLTTKEGKTQEYRSFMGPLPAMPFEVVAP